MYLSLETLALFNPQTSIGDFMLSLHFLYRCWNQIEKRKMIDPLKCILNLLLDFRAKMGPILIGVFGVTGLLSPVMLYLWLIQGTGNANFFFFQMIAFNACRITLLIEVATIARILDSEREKEKKE